MHSIDVGCAIIIKQGKLLIAQRKPGTFLGGYWEFPGGKKESRESMEDCLIREVAEELGILIKPRALLGWTHHTYPAKKLRLHFYFCDWVSGKPSRQDCLAFQWVAPEELRKFRFPLGDDAVIGELIRRAPKGVRRFFEKSV